MYFNKLISTSHDLQAAKMISKRTAVRAIIIEQGKILLVRSKHGYYKLPGGGVEESESLAEALVREVAEETGYLNCTIVEELGIVTEQRPDRSGGNTFFHMDSHHFLCELHTSEKTEPTLIGYEMEESYKPKWVAIAEAIESNESAYENDNSKTFIPRENFVLAWLMDNW